MDIVVLLIIFVGTIYATKEYITYKNPKIKITGQKENFVKTPNKDTSIKKLPPLKNKKGADRKTRNNKIDPDFQYILCDKPLTISFKYNNNLHIVDIGYITGSNNGEPKYLTGRILDKEGNPTLSYLTFNLTKIKNIKYKNKTYKNSVEFINIEIL